MRPCDAAGSFQWPASEVRETLLNPLTRTSEAKGHWQVYDRSAAFRFEVPTRACGGRFRNFKSAALLPIVLARDLRELGRVAEQAVGGAAAGAAAFQGAERGVDLGPAGAEQLRELALRKAEVERHALAGRRLTAVQGEQQEARQPHFQRMQRDGLELARRIAQTP